MEESVQLRTYTVADLKDWLIHNRPKEGLSSRVIAPARAYAIAHNPYVKVEMPAVCAVFVNDKIAAFTAAFPEILQRPNGRLAWWFTTLWCDPIYEGRGYGLVVVGTLAEEYGIENCFDSEGAPETVEILRLLGLKTKYYKKYVFSEKTIQKTSLRGKLAWGLNQGKKLLRLPRSRKSWKKLCENDFSICCQRYVDDASYAFIVEHSHSDFILRRQETFNWILQYPFYQTTFLREKAVPENQFSSLADTYQSYWGKIFSQGELVGVALLVFGPRSLSVKYLYYKESFALSVFAALLMHGIKYKAERIETNVVNLADFIGSFKLFTKSLVQTYSFSVPEMFPLIEEGKKTLQLGEGDMFV